MIVVAGIATTLFLGGWLRPFAGTPHIEFSGLAAAAFDAGRWRLLLVRAPKQPVKMQKLVMVLVAGMFAAIAGC
jgi:NADH:ubiquinone oxidoreductase subunit H